MSPVGYSQFWTPPGGSGSVDGVCLTGGAATVPPVTPQPLEFADAVGNSSWVLASPATFFGIFTVPAGSGIVAPTTAVYEVSCHVAAGLNALDAEFGPELVLYKNETLIGYSFFYSHQQPTIPFDSTIQSDRSVTPVFVEATAGDVFWVYVTARTITQSIEYFLGTLTAKYGPPNS